MDFPSKEDVKNLLSELDAPKRQGTYFNGDGDNAIPFTDEEVKAAKVTRDEIIQNNIQVLKSIYMAGEICMWDELRHNKPTQNEINSAFGDELIIK